MKSNSENRKNKNSLHLAFDVGHKSIGWAVLGATRNADEVNILGCGSVIFRADDCLANKRRDYRRQRRHIRSTRQRIERLKNLFEFLDILSREQLDAKGNSSPWKQAAQVVCGGDTLPWEELWNVLRWYAHNRGYDGNRRWSRQGDANPEDEKVKKADALMENYGTKSMAETICAVSGINPLGRKSSSAVEPAHRFKSQNAAFNRDIVRCEVRCLLETHLEHGQLDGLDDALIRCLIGNDQNDSDAWKTISVPGLKLPKRYVGSLLFGQLIPRFDNRIISVCPISGQKVPTRHCREFLEYRWAMQLANVRVASNGERQLRPLSKDERTCVHESMLKKGFLTKGEFKKKVREATNCERDNLETMLLHPDAEKALILDPVYKFAQNKDLKSLFPALPERIQRLALNRWRRGKQQSLADILDEAKKHGLDISAFESALENLLANPLKSRGKKKTSPPSRESVLNKSHSWNRDAPGRCPYARKIMAQATKEVMAGRHPLEKGGCLFVTDKMRHAQLNRPLPEQTNNHLIRHRLFILGRLLEDIVAEFAGGDKFRVARVTIEVNRDLREMSGKSAKTIGGELRLRQSDFKKAVQKIREEGQSENAGLIRKVRVAQDLDWSCPFTGKKFDVLDLVHGRVEREHIIPRSLRPTDALDALVMTFSAVNQMKGQRTAMQFINEEGAKTVQGAPNLMLFTPTQYREFVKKLESFKGHDDDKKRKERRKKWLLLPVYEEREFTPRDLTQTSQLVRLGAQVIQRHFQDCERPPRVISLPGSVTGAVRKSWNVLGCLARANPKISHQGIEGRTKTKTEIRGITQLHHALDACVLGLASHFIPNNGRVWELIVKRKLLPAEQAELVRLGVFDRDAEGQCRLRDLDKQLKEQIGNRLAERRVVQHLPARMDGLRVEENTWRVLGIENGEATLRQRIREQNGNLPPFKPPKKEKIGKLLGPQGNGKLAALKGALVIPDNFGIALDPQPKIIPFHKVWPRLNEIKENNEGKWPRVLRNGMLIRVRKGRYTGVWRVISTKNNANGINISIGAPDAMKPDKGNVLLRSVFPEMEILDCKLTGIACPTTS